MREYNRRWRSNGQRKHFCIRWWRHGNPLWDFCRWVVYGHWRRWRGFDPVRVELRTIPHCNDECYCPEGSETRFRLEFFGWGCWGWLSRSWTPQPCVCELTMRKLFPEMYEDDGELAAK